MEQDKQKITIWKEIIIFSKPLLVVIGIIALTYITLFVIPYYLLNN